MTDMREAYGNIRDLIRANGVHATRLSVPDITRIPLPHSPQTRRDAVKLCDAVVPRDRNAS